MPTRPHTQPLPTVGPRELRRLLTHVLRRVSRAFYLTIRVLPGALRTPVGLAYLLARAADTIADARAAPPARRLDALRRFRHTLDRPASAPDATTLADIAVQFAATGAERDLAAAIPSLLSLLDSLPAADAARIRSVVSTLTQGMEMDLVSFSGDAPVALPSFDDLDRYTYLVAGCVGEFWTETTVAATPALSGWDLPRMSQLGVGFGKALQLTNVLRDVPADLRAGRCYLPADWLAAEGLAPADLLDPANSRRARPVLARGLRVALEHFRDAETYCLAIPRRCVRLRLAVLWPALMGLATLALVARNDRWLDPARPSKVSRAWVYRTMALSLLAVTLQLHHPQLVPPPPRPHRTSPVIQSPPSHPGGDHGHASNHYNHLLPRPRCRLGAPHTRRGWHGPRPPPEGHRLLRRAPLARATYATSPSRSARTTPTSSTTTARPSAPPRPAAPSPASSSATATSSPSGASLSAST